MDPTSDHSPRTFITRTHNQTHALGQALGSKLNQGIVLLLFGELGSGKTVFAQGLARGLAVPSSYVVTSPTYTLVNEYPGRLTFFHADLYRLSAPVDPNEIGLAEILDADGVVAVEWPERLHPTDRPSRRIDLHFDITEDNHRSIRINAYGLDPSNLLNDIDV